MYICAVYIPPINSPYTIKHPYEIIERDISELCNDGEVLLMGDTNSRCADLQDYIEADKNDNLLNVDKTNCIDWNLSQRFSDDCSVNTYGKNLVDFCITCQLYIVNGRTKGDMPGKITCVQSAGCSTVDYAVASPSLKDKINYFNVTPFNGYSDHALIKLSIQVPILQCNTESSNLIPLSCKYVWNSKSKDRFLETFKNKTVQSDMKAVLQNKFYNTTQGITSLCDKVTNIYKEVADKGLIKKNPNTKPKVRKQNWATDKAYMSLRSHVNSLGKLLQRYPNDPILRGNYINTKKSFKKFLRKARSEQRE